MTIKRIVPDVVSNEPDLCRGFYADLLGLTVAMDMGWIATYVSPVNPTAQINVMRPAPTPGGTPMPAISVEVDDVDRIHAAAVERGCKIVYPPTDEPWGVRRFFVEDPNGVVVNVMCHRQPSA